MMTIPVKFQKSEELRISMIENKILEYGVPEKKDSKKFNCSIRLLRLQVK